MSVITRFAPSPTGDLHVGGARTALYSWLYARKHNGTFILRIEDTDQKRSSEDSTLGIIKSLSWLGLNHDGIIYYQSERLNRYQEVIQQLLDNGLAYKCNCSNERLEKLRNDLLNAQLKPKYDRHCKDKNITDGPFVIRFLNPDNDLVTFNDLVKGPISISNNELDDMIIQRTDGYPTYNFAAAVDDLDMQITHVIRGDDHVSNTPRQINLFTSFGAKHPEYAHLPMILGQDQKRLSKRHGANGVLEFRDLGILPQALLNYLVRLGWGHGDQEIFSINEMIEYFDLANVKHAPAAFDQQKLLWLNQHYIQTLDTNLLSTELEHQYKLLNVKYTANMLTTIIELYRSKVKTMQEMALISKYLFVDAIQIDSEIQQQYLTATNLIIINNFKNLLATCELWNKENLNILMQNFLQQHNLKMPQLGLPLRVALIGVPSSPALPDIMALMGKNMVITRLQTQVTQLL